MLFPEYRPRRMRQTETFRRMVRETVLSVNDLIMPVFVMSGENVRNCIDAMPGQYQLSIDNLMVIAQRAFDLGIPAIILFGIPSKKDSCGSHAYIKDGIVQCAVRALKKRIPNMVVISDVCLCQYTDHGHCGVIDNGIVDNDATLEILGKIALSHAQAGVDVIAPSDMMDGRVAKIRSILDANGFPGVPILSYAAKYCSQYYGPFRQAAYSKPNFGDRRSYQMDPANSREAVREVLMDIDEGADMVMIKPALSYLDVIYRIRQTTNLPIVAYNVSGEYSMVKAAHQMGWIDGPSVMIETLTSIKRAGADIILTYFALEAAELIRA